MATKVIGFYCDSYARYSKHFIENDGTSVFKNIVPLEEMTDKQRYETALEDNENTVIWNDIDSFLTDLNDECISVNNMWIYKYEENEII